MIPALDSRLAGSTPRDSQLATHLLPFISVLVPVRNEAECIHQTLLQILNQRYDSERFEIIVVDGQSIDATWSIVRALQQDHANLHLLMNPKRWSSAGRNAAVRAARGDILVVIDGHCHLDDPDHLTHLAHAFERSGADCVGRPQPLHVSGASLLQRAIALARSSRLGHHPDSFIYSEVERYVPPQSVAVAYRREVFELVGLFDETFDACEDVEFNHRVARAGLRCFFTPRVHVRYVPRDSITGLFRQMVRYGRGRIRLLRKHKETASVSCLLPAVFLCGLALGPVTLASSGLLAAYLCALGLYSLAVLGFSLGLTWQAREVRLLPWLALVFPAIHLGAGAGLLEELSLGVWSRINIAFGWTSAPTEKPAQILAWRTREEITLEPTNELPRSMAG
jgi:succinoglycan biosynthesis protein ExoA